MHICKLARADAQSVDRTLPELQIAGTSATRNDKFS